MILFYSVLYYTQWCVSLLSTQSGYHHFFFHLFPDLENQEENRAGNATVSAVCVLYVLYLSSLNLLIIFLFTYTT